MHFVTPALAVGSLADAGNAALRRQRGIEAVLSLTAVDFDAGEHHATIAVADRAALPSPALRAATGFIDRQVRAGRKVLVHCQMGISRSPAIAAGYLAEHGGIELPVALDQVCRSRPQAAPHPLLVDSLYREYGAEVRSAELSANENPLGASPLALAAAQAALGRSHRYPDRQSRQLRAALAARHGVAVEAVILGNGSCEILDLVARATLAPGDEAIIAEAAFLPYRAAVRRAHGSIVAVPLRADFDHDLATMLAAVTPRTRLVILGHPNNPTGTILDRAELDAFLDALPDHVMVLVDEAYADYLDAADKAADAIDCVRRGRRVIAARTFSKIHGLAGLRIGYAVAGPATAARLETWRPHYNTSAAAQAAALAALADADHLGRSRRLNAAGLAQLSAGCRALGLAVVPSQANFLLVGCGDAEHVVARLHALGVEVKSGAPFGLPGHVRISVGSSADNTRCLAALALAAPTTTPETGANAW